MLRMCKNLVWLCLFPVGVLFAQQQAGSEELAVERYASLAGLNINIHEGGTKLPDGTRSISLGMGHIDEYALKTCNVGSPCPVDPIDSLRPWDRNLRVRVCGATAILVGREVGSAVAITDNKSLIYTKHQVQVTSVIKAQAEIKAGQLIRIVQFGGTVVDGGEKVSLSFPQFISPVIGEEYLYFLVRLQDAVRPQDAPSDLLVPSQSYTDDKVRISSGRLVLDSGANDGFENSESVQAAADHMNDLLAKVPCSTK